MLIAIDSQQEYVPARLAQAGDHYRCPACQQPVQLRQGTVIQPYFAHQAGTSCHAFSEGESQTHLAGKVQLFRYLSQWGTVTLEPVLPSINQRPDLLLCRGQQRLAVEYQCSPITNPRLTERNRGYARAGIEVIWILGPRYFQKQLRTRTVLRFLHQDQLTFYLPDRQVFVHRGGFEKADFQRLRFSQVVNQQPFTVVHQRPLIRLNIDRQRQKIALQLLQGRVNPRLVNYLYQEGRRLTQVPNWVLMGRNFGLKVANWHFRLVVLLWLERLGPGAGFQIDNLQQVLQSYFWPGFLAVEAVITGLLQELVDLKYLVLEEGRYRIKKLPAWQQ
ncbi:competence protein CoiA family protein [Lactobacillaceae bacterium L1_55_11]|nr:competence protein CoiA family protein [Lactobacillaceae bacterium L1_55_11]